MLHHDLDQPQKHGVRSSLPRARCGPSHATLSQRLMQRGIRAMSKNLSVGQDIYRQGERCEHVYVLVEGWAFRHQMLPDGRRQILDFLLPGAVLGLSERETSSHGAETLTGCTVAVLPRGSVLETLRADPRSALELFEQMVESEARAFDHLTSLGRRSARERIAALMVELCGRVRALDIRSQPGSVALPLKQAHIADALGLTNEHVCRTLKTMRNDGLMSLADGQLHIHNLGRLGEEAGIDVAEEASVGATARRLEWTARRTHKAESRAQLTCAA